MLFLEKLRKIAKFVTQNLLNVSGRRGVFFPVVFYSTDSKGAKEFKPCRASKMLQNAPFLAIVAVDTDENEPSKVRQLDN